MVAACRVELPLSPRCRRACLKARDNQPSNEKPLMDSTELNRESLFRPRWQRTHLNFHLLEPGNLQTPERPG